MRRTPENWKGKWFCRMGWRVFPKSYESKVRALIKVQKDEYHHQVGWSLKDLKVADETKARSIAKEFLTTVTDASDHLPLLFEVIPKNLRKHSWKHSTYDQLQDLARRALGHGPTVHLDTMKPVERQDLLLRAVQKDPQAVAILTHNFPRKSDRVQIVAKYLGTNEVIPSVGDLAADYMDTIYLLPESSRANDARRKLNFLLTKKAVEGFPGRRGRMRKSARPGYLNDACLVGQGLFRQMREVSLLTDFNGNEVRRIDFLKTLYPWLEKVRVDREYDPLPVLFEMSPAKAAYYILEHVLKISRRKIEQILSDNRSFKRPHN